MRPHDEDDADVGELDATTRSLQRSTMGLRKGERRCHINGYTGFVPNLNVRLRACTGCSIDRCVMTSPHNAEQHHGETSHRELYKKYERSVLNFSFSGCIGPWTVGICSKWRDATSRGPRRLLWARRQGRF